MKTTKLVLIIAMLAFVSMSYADNADRPQLTERVTLRKAIADPGLCQAIYQQVDATALLAVDKVGMYTVTVKYRRVVYVIYGKYWEWKDFFLMDPVILPMLVIYDNSNNYQ